MKIDSNKVMRSNFVDFLRPPFPRKGHQMNPNYGESSFLLDNIFKQF